MQGVGRDPLDAFPKQNANSELLEHLRGVAGSFRIDRRQNTRGHVDQCYVELSACAEAAPALHGMNRMVKLGGKFDAGGAGTDDADTDPVEPACADLDGRLQKGSLQFQRLRRAVEHMAVFENTGNAEIVHPAAECQHQHIVRQSAFAQNLGVVRRAQDAVECYGLAHGINRQEVAEGEIKPVRTAMGEVVGFVVTASDQAGCDLVQARFPEMGGIAVHQQNLRLFAPKAMPQSGREFEATSASANNNDAG